MELIETIACEFTNEEAVMRETTRLGEEIQEGAERFGREFERAAESGFEAVSRSSVKLTKVSRSSRRK